MHISALLLCAVCWPTIFWAEDNVFKLGFPIFLATGICAVYCFIRQTFFLYQYPKYRKSKRRFFFETISFSACIILAVIIGIIELTTDLKSVSLVVYFIFKIYYVIYVTVTMCVMMSSAHRLSLVWKRESDSSMELLEQTDTKNINHYGICATIIICFANVSVLLAGIGNVLFFALSLPFYICGFIVSIIFIFIFFRKGYVKIFKLPRILLWGLSEVVSIIICNVFTLGKTIIDESSIKIEFEMYTFVLIPCLILAIVSLILLGRMKVKEDDKDKL